MEPLRWKTQRRSPSETERPAPAATVLVREVNIAIRMCALPLPELPPQQQDQSEHHGIVFEPDSAQKLVISFSQIPAKP